MTKSLPLVATTIMDLMSRKIKSLFGEHISQLINWSGKYFQEDNIDKFVWIQVPLIVKLHLNRRSYCTIWHHRAEDKICQQDTDFWKVAEAILIQYSTSYLYKAASRRLLSKSIVLKST